MTHVSIKASMALLAAMAALIASPLLIDHLCYLASPLIEIILVVVMPLALGVAVFTARRLPLMLALLIGAPLLNFGLTMLYIEWLHMETFPNMLLSSRARERRIELNEADKPASRAPDSAPPFTRPPDPPP